MDKLKYIFFFLLVIGCKTVKQDKTLVDLDRSKDSVHVFERLTQEKKRAGIKADSAQTTLDLNKPVAASSCTLNHCIKDTTVTKKSGRATQTTTVKDGVLVNKCHCDTAAIEYTIENRLRQEFTQRLNDHETVFKEKETVEVEIYPMWLKILAGIGVAAVIYRAFIIINYLKK